MRDTRLIMGMPITVEIVDKETASETLDAVFLYFTQVDERFSTYKETSEINRLNEVLITNGGAPQHDGARTEQFLSKEIVYPELAMSAELREIFEIAEQTKQETGGYFNIKKPDGTLDPSGIVKGWAIQNAAKMLLARGVTNFFIDAGGDIQAHGNPPAGGQEGREWSVGIRNPFNQTEIVKVIYPRGLGVATSGSYVRGDHIYNPLAPEEKMRDTVSITVVGPNVLEADRFATAAFAMDTAGPNFIEKLPGFEAYSIDKNGIATMTTGFEKLTAHT